MKMTYTLTDAQRALLENDANTEKASKKSKGWSDTLYPVKGRHQHKSARSLENRGLVTTCTVAPHDGSFIRPTLDLMKAIKATKGYDAVSLEYDDKEDNPTARARRVSLKRAQDRNQIAKTAILSGLLNSGIAPQANDPDELATAILDTLTEALTLRLPKGFDNETDTTTAFTVAVDNYLIEMKN